MDDQERSALHEEGKRPPESVDEPDTSPPDADPVPPEAAVDEPSEGESAAEAIPATGEQPAPPDASWPRCDWCSTPNPPDAETCRHCRAALKPSPEVEERSIYGLTEVDPGLIEHDLWLRSLKDRQKAARAQSLRPRAKAPGKAPAEAASTYAPDDEAPAFQPPPESVRSEMVRMEAEAAAARAQAEAEAKRVEELLAAEDQAAEVSDPLAAAEPAEPEPAEPAEPEPAEAEAEPEAPEDQLPPAPPANRSA